MSEGYSKAVKKIFEREAKEYQERVDYWNSQKGQRVKHEVYLLLGTIKDVMPVPMTTFPRIIVEWDNGAESSEVPISFQLLEEKKT